MINSVKYFICFIALILQIVAIGQEKEIVPELSSDLQEQLENITENLDAAIDFSNLTEDLIQYLENPLNLNAATADELYAFPLLDERQAFSILAYRESYGSFQTIYEIQALDGFNKKTIAALIPFVKVEPVARRLPLQKVILYGRSRLMLRYQRILQQRAGYRNISDSALLENPGSYYLGDPARRYLRYDYRAGNRFRFGFLAEQDAGELFNLTALNDTLLNYAGIKKQSVPDFISGHIGIFETGVLKTFVLGDFQLEFGQGLTLWSSLAFGKGGEVAAVKRYARKIRPHTSSEENLFLRGGAATVALDPIDLTVFYSNRVLDATTNESEGNTANLYEFSSFRTTGLHRTLNELKYKDKVSMELFGGHAGLNHKNLHLGLTAFGTNLQLPLTEPNVLYQQFNFSGRQNFNAGLDYNAVFRRLSIFGEMAVSNNGGFAQLHGMQARVHPSLGFVMLFRDYRRDYQNLFANPIAESSFKNEQGVYTGIDYSLSKDWNFSAYLDIYRFPWLKYRTNSPSNGSDVLLQVSKQINPGTKVYFRFKTKSKLINLPGEEAVMPALTGQRKNSYRLQLSYEINENLSMKNRAEVLVFESWEANNQTGYLLFQDVAWKARNNKIKINGRFALFDTESYDERIYAYENDALYAFSVPAYYYRGSRVYLLVKYSLAAWMDCWLRVAHTEFQNQTTIGTGADLIDGSGKTEVKVQVLLKL